MPGVYLCWRARRPGDGVPREADITPPGSRWLTCGRRRYIDARTTSVERQAVGLGRGLSGRSGGVAHGRSGRRPSWFVGDARDLGGLCLVPSRGVAGADAQVGGGEHDRIGRAGRRSYGNYLLRSSSDAGGQRDRRTAAPQMWSRARQTSTEPRVVHRSCDDEVPVLRVLATERAIRSRAIRSRSGGGGERVRVRAHVLRARMASQVSM